MSQRTEKKDRKARRLMIRAEIDANKDLVLNEVVKSMLTAGLKDRLKFAYQIVFKKV